MAGSYDCREAEDNFGMSSGSDKTGPPLTGNQLSVAVRLLMKCVPVLDLSVSEHNDGGRLRRDICMFLAGLGHTGWIEQRDR